MNKFQIFFDKSYKEIINVLTNYLKNEDRMIDLGCNNGNLEAEIDSRFKGNFVYCVDIDKDALNELRKTKFKNLEIEVVNSDATNFLKVTKLANIDAVIINATLHEINDFKNQGKYLDWLFKILKRILTNHGLVILGDYYYPPSVSEKDVKSYMKYQLREIHHADAREKFIMPDLIKSKALENGFEVAYFNDFRAVKQINRRYFSLVLKKSN